MTTVSTDQKPVNRLGGHYEEMPYDSYPFTETQPEFLAALATFYGLKPPAVTSARVLELGCASGGNLIPAAARFPEAQFVGYDLSARHVEIAREKIAALGLKNIDILRGDLARDDMVEGEFDYILCHGVFSWVSPAAQDGILNICARNLTKSGIAYVSYNVLPGWQLRKIVRDIFLFDDDPKRGIADRVARGRWLLEQLAKGSNQGTPYGQVLRREVAALAAQSDSYIMSEFLAEENSPCYFHQFLDRAEAAGLAFLTESNLQTSMPQGVNPQLDQLIRAMSGPSVRMFEQNYDFLQGRQFRQSLLVRADAASAIQRVPDKKRIAPMHFTAKLRLDPAEPGEEKRTLRDPAGLSISTNDPMVATALDFLGASFPQSRSLRDIVFHLRLDTQPDRQAVLDRVVDALQNITMAGLCKISAEPLKCGQASDAKPKVWNVAALEGRSGQPWLTSLRHVPVKLDETGNALLPFVDGRNDKAALVAKLMELIKNKALNIGDVDGLGAFSDNTGLTSQQALARVETVLKHLQDLALLEPVA